MTTAADAVIKFTQNGPECHLAPQIGVSTTSIKHSSTLSQRFRMGLCGCSGRFTYGQAWF